MNICVFGDSITWGAFLPFRGAWVNLLRNYLEGKNSKIALYDLGIDGNTTIDLIKRFGLEASVRNPEIIIFAIGVNDSAYRKTLDYPLVSQSEFSKNIEILLHEAKNITKKIIVLGLVKGDDTFTNPLPRSTTGKCYTRQNVEKYNNLLQAICKKQGLLFVDIWSKLIDEDFDDGLHPNLGGHMKIFEEVRRAISKSSYIQ